MTLNMMNQIINKCEDITENIIISSVIPRYDSTQLKINAQLYNAPINSFRDPGEGGRATFGKLTGQSRPWGRDLTDNCMLPVGKLTTRGNFENCVFFNLLKLLCSVELR